MLNVRPVRLVAITGLMGLLAACGASPKLEALSDHGSRSATTTTEAGEPTTTTQLVSSSTTAAARTTAPSTTTTVAATQASEAPWPVDDPDVLTFVDAPQPAPGTRETWRDEHGNLSPFVKRVRYVHANTDALLAAFSAAVDDDEGEIRLRLFRDLLVQVRDVDEGGGSGHQPPPYTTWDEESFYAHLYDNGRPRTFVTLFWSETTRQDGYHSEYLHLRAGNWIEIDLVGEVFGIYELDEDRLSYDD